MRNIFSTLGIIFLLLTILSLISQGTIWLPVMFLLGATAGIPVFMEYPHEFITKLFVGFGLIVSLSAIIYGLRNSEKPIGQTLAVVGFLVWTFLGTVCGLSTGT